jgi:serine/threonine-protein kinase
VEADFETGQRFGAYLLGKVIGRGGMGVVYSAEHVHLGRTVALKLLAPELSTNEDFRARFLRESRLAAALDHPSVVTVYDAGDVHGVLYIAMQFVRGTDLAGLLASRGPMATGETLAILEQVASALDAAHVAGLVHRDVKPANVMIEGQRCYLTDFGLTKRTSSASTRALTAAGQFLGTLAYVSPEQIEGRELDGRADEYALGCVLHECLTGSRPYPRPSEIAVVYAHLRDPPPRPTELRPDLPPSIDAVVGRAMAKRPAERYATCTEMVAAARAALDEPTPSTAPHSPPTAPYPPPTAPLPAEPTPPPRAPDRPRTAATAPLRPPGPPGPPGPPVSPPPPSPPPRAPERRRSLALPLALLAVLVIGGVVAAIVLSGGGDGGKKAAVSKRDSSSSGGGGGGGGGSGSAQRAAGPQFDVGDRPAGLVRGGDFVWIANAGDGTVTRMTEDGESRKDIDTGEGAFAVGRSADAMWVANSVDNTVSRIDFATSRVSDPIPVGAKPQFVAAQDDIIWVSNTDDDTVTVLDDSGAEQGPAISVGSEPRGMSVSDDGALWVANSGEGTVSRVEGDQVTETVQVGSEPADLSSGGGAIWVANEGSDTVSRIDTSSSPARVKTTKVGDAPFGMAFGEGFAWVTNSADGTVMRLDPDSGKVVGDALAVPGRPMGITASQGSVLVTSADTDKLTRISP